MVMNATRFFADEALSFEADRDRVSTMPFFLTPAVWLNSR